MAQKTINLGTSELAGDGESIRSAFDKINDNFTETYNDIATNLASAFDGDYNSLSNKPVLFSGDYNDLTNQPTLFDGDYNNLTNQPTLFSGNYDDLSNKPDLSNYRLIRPVQVVANNTLSIDALNPTVLDIDTYSGLHITAPVQGSQPQLSLPDGSVNGQTFFIYIYHTSGATPSVSLTTFNRTTGVAETQSISYVINSGGMNLFWAGTGWAVAD